MLPFITLSILIRPFFVDAHVDYFDPDFDESKNCKHEELMKQLKADPSRCSRSSSGSDIVQWEECKRILSQQLAKTCLVSKIKRVIQHKQNDLIILIKGRDVSLLQK